MHEGSCHCGAVRLTLPSTPEVATDCNCSLCRRIGGPWVYFPFGSVKIDGQPESTTAYVQGDRTLSTIRCSTCGCVTHWEPIPPVEGTRHGVNLANFDPALIASVRTRRFDGADTWTFWTDEVDMAHAGPEALTRIQELIRQLRGIPQVREKQPGTYHLVGQPFVHFHDEGGKLIADLKKASGTGFDRYPVDAAPDRRKFIDEAKRRAAEDDG